MNLSQAGVRGKRGTLSPGSRRIILPAILAGALSAPLSPALVYARHFTNYDYVPAMTRCTAQAADTLLGTVPACSNPEPISNCTSNPTTALKLAPGGRTRLIQYSTGRKKSIKIGQAIDLIVKFKAKGILRCDESPYTGDITLRVRHRLTLSDTACTGGFCTVPDRFFDYTIPCRNGRCRLRSQAVSQMIIAQGKLPFPQRPWWAQVASVDLLDLAGRPFLTHGLVAVKKGRGANPDGLRAGLFMANYIDAFEECLPGSESFTTSDGFAACAGVPVSDCATDPVGALHFGLRVSPETEGGSRHGKLFVRSRTFRSGLSLQARGSMLTLRDCNDDPYRGELSLVLGLRITCYGPACGQGGVTAVDSDIQAVIPKPDLFGISLLGDVLAAAGFPPLEEMAPVIMDIRKAEVLDLSGRPFATLSGMRVACSPSTGNTVCFGL